ncbi:MAG: murein transglycosylase A [Pigmentiphaga sp.]|nr:murein transglycosylase A [Pigmentiphaga sp.]
MPVSLFRTTSRRPGGRSLALAFLALATGLLAACSTTDDRSDDGSQALAILEHKGPAPTPPAVRPAGPPALPSIGSANQLRAGSRLGHFALARWNQIPSWQADDTAVLWQAFLRNCEAVLRRGLGGPGNGSAVAAARPWHGVCTAAFDPARAPDAADAASVQRFLETWLQPWRVQASGRPAVNTVTGYYEPLVRASRQRGGDFQWPLYAVPDDMLVIDLGAAYPELQGKRVRGKLDGRRVIPYDTRAELEANGRQPPAIVWVDDPVDAFFLQVQGSGRAELANGTAPDANEVIRLAYADQNGHAYSSIGRWLVDQGELTLAQASMQNIRAWAQRNPQRVRELLNVNPSVVFFREEPIEVAGEGPRGAFGVPLTAQHSIAVDPAFVPLGSPVLLATTFPGTQRPLNRLAFAQDTGSAIKGAGRADFYWGFGDEAGALAGRMKQSGQMWVLWPKDAGPPAVDR